MACKKCTKVFRKDSSQPLDDSDEYCPHCDNHYVIEALEPKPVLMFESDDPRFLRQEQQDSRMKPRLPELGDDELLELMSA